MELTPKVLLGCGILEDFWDKELTDFYGHPDRKGELMHRIHLWNTAHPKDTINIDFKTGEKILKEIQTYINNLGNARKYGISLFLWGPNGSGKTMLGCCVLKAAIRKGFTAQMTSLGGIIEVYAGSWTNSYKRELFNNRIKNVDFLFIDDVGKEYKAKSNDLVEIAFDNLIRYRSFRNKPTIITTNATINDLAETYGRSLESLLYGKSIGIWVGGVDYRRAIQAKDLKGLLTRGKV